MRVFFRLFFLLSLQSYVITELRGNVKVFKGFILYGMKKCIHRATLRSARLIYNFLLILIDFHKIFKLIRLKSSKKLASKKTCGRIKSSSRHF